MHNFVFWITTLSVGTYKSLNIICFKSVLRFYYYTKLTIMIHHDLFCQEFVSEFSYASRSILFITHSIGLNPGMRRH